MGPAIIVIDVINDFVSGALGSERAAKIVPSIRRLLRRAREGGVPVVYATDAHLPDGDREFDIWPRHAVDGSEGARVVDALRPEAGDYQIKKRRYSAFYATGFDALLRELGVDTVVLTGLVTNICVQHTAADAFFRGYRVVVPRDCVEAPTGEAQEASLGYMGQMYGAEITSSEELVAGGLLGGRGAA
ncbi:MAG: cysteine hydrolase [Candidatus Bathyarchaeota archaeon]|nr:cysteine hydrolase [Candidatus Bathyarchaeota archaeon]